MSNQIVQGREVRWGKRVKRFTKEVVLRVFRLCIEEGACVKFVDGSYFGIRRRTARHAQWFVIPFEDGVDCQALQLQRAAQDLKLAFWEGAENVRSDGPGEVLSAPYRHEPESSGEWQGVPCHTYSAMEMVEGHGTTEGGGGGASEAVARLVEALTYVPAPGDVEQVHLCGSFICWEIREDLLVVDDSGHSSAVHLFSEKDLALDVLRGRIGRRAARLKEGHIQSFRHTGDWEERVEDALLKQLG